MNFDSLNFRPTIESNMFDPVILFSTITLLILIGAAFWLEIPKLSIPLIGVYVIFLFFSLSEKKPNPPINIDFPPIESPMMDSSVVEVEKDSPDTVIVQKEAKSKIELKPLVFEKNDALFKDSLKKETTLKPITKEKEIEEKESTLNIKQMSICKNIINRKPIQSGKTFSTTVDSLFCYTLLSNTGGKQHLTHIWEYDNKVMSKIRYSVKHSSNWRSWTRKTILPHQTGLWSVSVEDTSGAIIKKIQFNIVNENE